MNKMINWCTSKVNLKTKRKKKKTRAGGIDLYGFVQSFLKEENSEAAQGSCRTCFHYKVENNMANAVCRQQVLRFLSNENNVHFWSWFEKRQRRHQKPFRLTIPRRRRRPQNIKIPKRCALQSPPMTSFAHTQFRHIDKMSGTRLPRLMGRMIKRRHRHWHHVERACILYCLHSIQF